VILHGTMQGPRKSGKVKRRQSDSGEGKSDDIKVVGRMGFQGEAEMLVPRPGTKIAQRERGTGGVSKTRPGGERTRSAGLKGGVCEFYRFCARKSQEGNTDTINLNSSYEVTLSTEKRPAREEELHQRTTGSSEGVVGVRGAKDSLLQQGSSRGGSSSNGRRRIRQNDVSGAAKRQSGTERSEVANEDAKSDPVRDSARRSSSTLSKSRGA